jgi:hypothetical protein
MTAFAVTKTIVPTGQSTSQFATFLLQAMTDAGYPAPTIFTSGNVTIYSYNLPIPGGSRTATYLLRIDTGSLFSSSNYLQQQIVDSTQYNSGTGVVTNGIGFQATINIGTGSTTTIPITLVSYKSKNSSGTEDDRFNTVSIQGTNSILLGAGLPYPKVSAAGYAGDYVPANHCLAYQLDSSTANGELTGYLTTLNPFSVLTTAASAFFDNSHKPPVINVGDTSRQIVTPIGLRYAGTGSFKHSIFAELGPDIGYTSAVGAVLGGTLNSEKWEIVSIGTSSNGCIVYRIAD